MAASEDRETKDRRQIRLAQALRQNLRRRKARQSGENDEQADEAPGGVAERDC